MGRLRTVGVWAGRVLWMVVAAASLPVFYYASWYKSRSGEVLIDLRVCFFLAPLIWWWTVPLVWRRLRASGFAVFVLMSLMTWLILGGSRWFSGYAVLYVLLLPAGCGVLAWRWKQVAASWRIALLLVLAWTGAAVLTALFFHQFFSGDYPDYYAGSFYALPGLVYVTHSGGPIWTAWVRIALSYLLPLMPLLLVSLCQVYQRNRVGRRLAYAVCTLVFSLTAASLAVQFKMERWPEFQIPRERLEVKSDRREDKHPVYIDSEEYWLEWPSDNETDSPIRLRINKTPVIYSLHAHDRFIGEDYTEEPLCATYAEAMHVAQDDVSVLPSLAMMQHKAKVFEDRLMAAITEHIHFRASSLGGGMDALFGELLAAVLASPPQVGEDMQAIVHLAAGLQLGGAELPPLSDEAERARQREEKTFLENEIQSKLIGFYVDSPALRRVFRQSRFFQQEIATATAIQIAFALQKQPELQRRYECLLALNQRLHNPGGTFSLADALSVLGGEQDANNLCRALTEKFDHVRGCSISLLPYATSRETEFFERLYAASPFLSHENSINQLLRAVRSGELSLYPEGDSGWYDYKSYSLEPLVMPECAQEYDKLSMSSDYKKYLLDLFKSALAQRRETHLYAMQPTSCSGDAIPTDLPPPEFTLIPELALEPSASYLLRTAQAFQFVLRALRELLPEEELERIILEDGRSLTATTEEIARLYYGLYLYVCEDIGMAPYMDEIDLEPAAAESAKVIAKEWVETIADDPDFCLDTRYAVPVMLAPLQGQARYWLCLGVTMKRLYVRWRRPALRFYEADSGEVLFELGPHQEGEGYGSDMGLWKWCQTQGIDIHNETSTRYLLPVQVFAVADGPLEPFTREEFRALCDRHQNQKAIVRAVEEYGTFPWRLVGTLLAFVAVGVVLGLLLRWGTRDAATFRGRRASQAVPPAF